MDSPFNLTIIEVDMEPIAFKYSFPPEPFSGIRPQDAIKDIAKITKPVKPKNLKFFISIYCLKVTPKRVKVVPEVLVVHVIPSGEVIMVPFFPTATKVLFPKVTP